MLDTVDGGWSKWGDRTQVLNFLAMLVHSIPEGVAVGVGYASGEIHDTKLARGTQGLAGHIHSRPSPAAGDGSRRGGAPVR